LSLTNSVYKYFNADVFVSRSSLITNDDLRLNASYYEEKKSLLIKDEISFSPLSSIATVVFPGIFKRYLTTDEKYGIKFLTTSDMMLLEPDSDKILSFILTPNIEIYRVSEHTILVSRSGTIGNTIYVDDRIKNFALTEDALRVKPFDELKTGLLYFYFTSEYGNALITGKKSGAVIDHIYEDDLIKLPIPEIDDDLVNELFEFYLKIKRKRELAHKKIIDARSLVLQYNNLPPLSEEQIETLDPEKETEIRLTNLSEFTDDYRLDAHFYNPISKLVVSNIDKYSNSYESLFNLSDCQYKGGRSVRNYVTKEFGIPFLSGKNIVQIRPDLKFISKTETNNLDDMIIHQNQILISRSGTLGRAVFIWNNYENYAASEHLIRVNPFIEKIDPGYLYAFLSSDYGYHQLLRYKHGAVIDEITEDQISKSIVPISNEENQKEIGDLVRLAYDLRAEAIKLEDEAQEILTKALTKNN